MAQTVIGIFDNASEAQTAVQQLISSGFSRSNVDLSAQGSTAAGLATGSTATGSTSSTSTSDSHNDGIGGFFRSLFGGDDDADRYSHVARRSTLVTVHAQSMQEAQRAADILDQYGAVDVNERASQYGYSGASTTNMGTANTATTTADTTNPGAIPIIEEQLQVGKRVVETGGVRLRSRIIERPVEESLRLREEHVHLERHAVNRPANEADLANFKEGTIEMTEHAEVPVVAKEARVVEEVSLNKEVTEHTETIRDTVRNTDVEAEQLRADEQLRRNSGTTRSSDDLNRPSSL